MGVAPETKLIVKHTFLEFVHDSPLHKELRARAQTDSTLVCRNSGNDASPPGSAVISSEDESSFAQYEAASETVDAQAQCPLAQFPADMENSLGCQPASWAAETMVPWLPCYTAWDAAQAWWMPTNYDVAGQVGAVPSAQLSQESDAWKTERFSSRSHDSAAEDSQTTVMLRNLPNNYTREMLLELVNSEGFSGQYDFLYLPIDFNSQAGLGYAFVNLITSSVARRFWNHFTGFSRWDMPSDKVCSLNWSSPHQGLAAHIERYRDSPVMHEAVSDECKPMIFADGVRIRFPSPTKPVKAPRLRVRDSSKIQHR